MPRVPSSIERAYLEPGRTMDPVDVLDEECERFAAVARSLDESDFVRPTRCPPWTVKDLVGHVYRDIDRILEYRDAPVSAPVDTTAVSYWTRYDPVDDAADISRRAIEVAARYESGRDLARAFEARRRDAVNAARAMDPGRAIATFAPTMRLDEYVATRVLEVGVHGLDLAAALERAPWLTPGAASIIRAILRGLVGGAFPDDLAWDDVTLIEAGTGRRRLDRRERSLLGERADRFPLLA